jgi:LDH2 family malate/lactate/ureidoglycolate dehydrogenase
MATDAATSVVGLQDLRQFVAAIFAGAGMDDYDAALMARILTTADLRGIATHGVSFVPVYVDRLLIGGVDPLGKPRVASEHGGVLVVDGGNNLGHLAAAFAMERAVEHACLHGVSAVSVRHSNHCGMMAYYSMMAPPKDMIGLATTNALPTMAPWGGVEQLLGNNPLSVAVPAGDERPIVLDTAFQSSFPLKIELWRQRGWPIPDDWAFDPQGRPTTDYDQALAGFGQPVGKYRGFGLAFVTGVLGGLLADASWGLELGTLATGPHPGEDGHLFMAFDIAAFVEVSKFKSRMDGVIQQLRQSKRAADVDRIYMPGEREAETLEHYSAHGIPLPANVVAGLIQTAERVGVDPSVAKSWVAE